MRVGIIGAGISGLATAVQLLERGVDVEVLEASQAPGGTIQSREEQGFLTESGPNGWLDREPAMRRLISTLGLEAKLRPANDSAGHRFLFSNGAIHPVPGSPPALLKSKLLPLSTKLRLAGELFSRRAPEGVDESLASFARRHLGKHATAVLVDAMQSGIFAGDVERLSLAACFPRMAELERDHRSLVLAMIRLQRERKRSAQAPVDAQGPSGTLTSLEGGLHTLISALAAKVGPRLTLGARVTGVEAGAGGFRVQLAGGARSYDQLVLALPAWGAADLLRPVDAALADELAQIRYASVAAVHVGYRDEGLPPHEGFGFLVPAREQRRILGALYISSIFPWRAPGGHALFTVMVGGARHPEHVALGDAALEQLVREELAATLGIHAAPIYRRLVRWERGIPQYEVGHLARIDRIDARLAGHPGLHLTGNAYRGVGMNDCVRNAEALADALAKPFTA